MIYVIIIGVAVLAIVLWFKWFRLPPTNTLVMVTGGVKVGKSTFAIYLTYKRYKKELRRWKLRKVFRKLLKKPPEEKPRLISNIPLAVDYTPLTEDLIKRDTRPPYRSCIYCGEASLISDSQSWRDQALNDATLLFNKLIGHELHGGGCLVYDTQNIADVHYNIKRSASEYLYLSRSIKLPFFIAINVRSMINTGDQTAVNVINDDMYDTGKWVLVPKRIWKIFDYCCYSVLTDEKPVDITQKKGERGHLKARDIISFRRFKIDEK